MQIIVNSLSKFINAPLLDDEIYAFFDLFESEFLRFIYFVFKILHNTTYCVNFFLFCCFCNR